MTRQKVKLGEIVENFDAARRPVKSAERRPGPYPYYGASGIIDHVDGFTHDGTYLLIAEDGENLRSRNTPIAFVAHGKFWANNHVHVVRGNDRANTQYLSSLLVTVDISGYLSGTTLPKLSRYSMDSIRLTLPPLPEQLAIAAVVGALDDKIAANRFAAATNRQLALAHFELGHRAADVSSRTTVSIANLIERGDLVVGDGYRTKRAEHAETGFRIIRVTDVIDGSVVPTGPDRVAGEFAKAIGSKAGRRGDVVLTTKGTVGRVALTPDLDDQIVYSPQICYFRCSDTSSVDRFYLRYWFESPEFQAQAENRMNNTDMAPYISLADIRSLQLTIPEPDRLRAVSHQLAALENSAQALLRENACLANLRDTLLPHLMSGRLRVKDAEKQVEAVV